MMCFNPNTRISAKEALIHPWISSNTFTKPI